MNIRADISAAAPTIPSELRAWLSKDRNLLIDGKWVPAKSGKTFEVSDPATCEIITRCAEGHAADVDLAVKAARRGFLLGDMARADRRRRPDHSLELPAADGGLEARPRLGPLVSSVQDERVTGYLSSGKDKGAKEIICDGDVPSGRGYFVAPRILADTNPNMKVVREEIFGPVLVSTPFDEFVDMLIAAANNSVYGLAAGLWGKDTARAQRVAHRLRAGTVWINCYHVFDAALPFGGYKQSGWGREMGQAVLSNYLETKAITTRLGTA